MGLIQKARFLIRIVDKKTNKSKNFSLSENGKKLEEIASAVKDFLRRMK